MIPVKFHESDCGKSQKISELIKQSSYICSKKKKKKINFLKASYRRNSTFHQYCKAIFALILKIYILFFPSPCYFHIKMLFGISVRKEWEKITKKWTVRFFNLINHHFLFITIWFFFQIDSLLQCKLKFNEKNCLI